MDPGDGYTSSGTGVSTLRALTVAGNTLRRHVPYTVIDGKVMSTLPVCVSGKDDV